MKKTIFYFGLFLALGLTGVVFNSCDKDDDTDGGTNDGQVFKITATNVINDSAEIKTVKAIVYWESGDYDYGSDAIAQAPYQNNGFTLELPEILDAKYLETLDAEDLEEIFVSDNNFKFCTLDDLNGYNSEDEKIGEFYLVGVKEDGVYFTFWLYVDRDVTINGEYSEIDEEDNEEYIEIYDLTLKKGWNVVYASEMESPDRHVYTATISSKKPSDVNYAWYFSSYDDLTYHKSSASQALKLAKNPKSLATILKENLKKH
ncbi:MAG TPA: hypothetical protein ENN49_06505 [Bacteroidales bacterium]|nr:hypothetical protein [Bacteroidales bacterium]